MEFKVRKIADHTDHVHFIAFSPDSKKLASCSDDNTIRIWDCASGENINIIERGDYPGKGIAFSPDGKYLASGSDDFSVRLWNPKTGEMIHNLKGMFFANGTYVWRVAFSPDSKRLASISQDQHIRIWNTEKFAHLKSLKVPVDKSWLVCFSPDGSEIISQGEDYSIWVWDCSRWEVCRSFYKHSDTVTSIDFSRDGKLLAGSSVDGSVIVWNYETADTIKEFRNHESGVSHVAFSPCGMAIVSAGMDKTVRICDLYSGEELVCLKEFDDAVFTVAFSPDGKYLAACSRDGNICIWEIPTEFWSKISDIGYGKKMVTVSGMSFEMGDTTGDGQPVEKPVHTVKLNSFYISKNVITMDEYDVFSADTGRPLTEDSGWGRGDRPVTHISWFDAIEYCNWLSNREGFPECYVISGKSVHCNFELDGYRLPTEAEWEHASKGGRESNNYKYSGSNNADEVAWIMTNSDGKTHPVGQKKPNELGLYDMSGNVWEWCWDWYKTDYYKKSPLNNPTGALNGTNKVLRGGRWGCYPRRVRVSFRRGSEPEHNMYYFGFRIARTKLREHLPV
ncbi:SUMF1/EgtB/PvdO family nonheme iron enzyme [bacterium]|nr:SUMF1/EgtB/PvdO family nonheme iron enzyme [bacterium]